MGRKLWRQLNPYQHLAAGVIWLVVALAAVFSMAASLWVGSIVRDSVIAQHMRRLSLETDQLSSAVTQAVAERLSAIRVTETLLRHADARPGGEILQAWFAELRTAYPQLDWMAVAAADGTLIDGTGSIGEAAGPKAWLLGGLKGPWIGAVDEDRTSSGSAISPTSSLGGLAAPIHDASGRVIGVVYARLSWRRTEHHPPRLTDDSGALGSARAYLLDADGIVTAGPPDLLGRRWPGKAGRISAADPDPPSGPHWERLTDGSDVLVARERVSLAPDYPALTCFVQLSEPRDLAYQRADSLALRIWGISSLLAAFTALIGVVGARHLTLRLTRLAQSVTAAGHSDSVDIEVPRGGDEVAQLGAAFANILGDLQRERRELERRVAVRTREVERLGEEARYAAIIRERLKIGRDLHDTLAHSMMAMLSEIRYLRRLHDRDPQAVREELERAEAMAHEGLKEARSAIAQMRVSTLRETGLGEALTRESERFTTRTGIPVELAMDSEAARVADDRAETLLRMAQEAIRNIERHSLARTMSVSLQLSEDHRLILQIEDDGVGFDPSAATPGHYGIVGLREQADLIDARLVIRSKPGEGTVLCVDLKLSPERFGDVAAIEMSSASRMV